MHIIASAAHPPASSFHLRIVSLGQSGLIECLTVTGVGLAEIIEMLRGYGR